MKKSIIIGTVISIFIIGILIGVFVFNNSDSDTNIIENENLEISEVIIDECTEEWKKMQKEETEVSSDVEKISPNCKLILKKYYKECEHTINEYLDMPMFLVNKSKGDLEKAYENWDIEKYTESEITLYKEIDSSCGQHYILRDNNGKVSIYLINENNEEELHENTEITVEYLTDEDKSQIKEGIKVNGKEELSKIIEDFE